MHAVESELNGIAPPLYQTSEQLGFASVTARSVANFTALIAAPLPWAPNPFYAHRISR